MTELQQFQENIITSNVINQNHFKNNFHVFRSRKKLKMQDNFIFFDTESTEKKIDSKTKKLKFKLGSCIIYNREENLKHSFMFHDISKFWNEIEKKFDKNHKQYIMFAHNVHFDMKMVDGFNQLKKRDWILDNFYVRNRTYILLFKKDDYILHVWDTGNYFIKGFSVAQMGKTVGFPKLKVDFKKCSLKELEIYCMRDTEILFVFMSKLIDFLIENDLSNLKATSSSLSFNIFRYRFYDENDYKIIIHDWKRSIWLERKSYKGGITDVFRLGYHENIYKTDINSHYPKAMKELKLPIKLIHYTSKTDPQLINLPFNYDNRDYTENERKEIKKRFNQLFNDYRKDDNVGLITRCKIFLPKKYAYILDDFGLGKTSFAWGKLEVVLSDPELDFVEKHGKILEVIEFNAYEIKEIFKEFVEFFSDLKNFYDKQGNKVFRDFCKLILNGQYGKWGQKEYISRELTIEDDFLIKNQDIILDIIKEKITLITDSNLVYLGSLNAKELYVIDKKLYLAYNTNNNSKESFVAISSFITSKARMNLIEFALIAERRNCYYTDTDSLFVNEKGYQNLLNQNCISERKLGKLKIEGRGNAQFYNPKFYDFFDDKKDKMERKCKGVKQKNSEIIQENDKIVKYQIELWDKFKSDYKKGNFNNQLIHVAEKIISKKYGKGIIMNDGYIEPYHVSQIKE